MDDGRARDRCQMEGGRGMSAGTTGRKKRSRNQSSGEGYQKKGHSLDGGAQVERFYNRRTDCVGQERGR